MYASVKRNTVVVQALIEANVDINLQDKVSDWFSFCWLEDIYGVVSLAGWLDCAHAGI